MVFPQTTTPGCNCWNRSELVVLGNDASVLTTYPANAWLAAATIVYAKTNRVRATA